jgi:L-idonate 5-dehydrogenase
MALAGTRGAESVTATDLHDRPLQTARQANATHVVVAGEEFPVADIVFESSDAPQALAAALHAPRPGGTLIQVSQLPSNGVSTPLHLAVARELVISG